MMDFLVKVNPVMINTYRKSMEPLRDRYQFDVVGDSSIEIGKYVIEDLTPDQIILPLFGLIRYEDSLKNEKTCMNSTGFLDGKCHKGKCLFWDKCIFERKGKK